MIPLFRVLALCAVLVAAVSSQLGAQNTPAPLPSATASHGPVVRFAGQLLDAQKGFVFFTTGDGFALAPDVRIVDYRSGGATNLRPQTRIYARAAFDQASGRIVELGLSSSKIPAEAAYADIKKFAVALSQPVVNADLQRKAGSSDVAGGKLVLVTFTVRVPPATPLSDDVYIATDASNWNPVAIKMDRVDALRYRITQQFHAGSKLLYRYTRGSFTSEERSQGGLEVDPHGFTVRDQDVIRRDDVVYHWADENPSKPGRSSGAFPTPFNPAPFGAPLPGRPLPPAPKPPRPTPTP